MVRFGLYFIVTVLIGLLIISVILPVKFEWIMTHSKLFLNTLFETKGWMLLLLVFFSFLGVIKLIEFMLSFYPNQHKFHKYKQDTFKQALWKWKWQDDRIEQLWCYCPTCNNELSYNSDYLLYKTDLLCPNCEKLITSYDGDNINYVLTKVKSEIRRVVQRQLNEEIKQ